MAIRDLLIAFQDEQDLPVDLNKVTQWIKAKGNQDEIEFVGVELDVGIIRGFLHRFSYRPTMYGDPVYAAHIYYAVNQPEEWINIVVAKELVHIMDGHCIGRKAEFDNLVKRLTLPNELKIILEDPAYALMDRFGDAFAAAILLPMRARELLKQAYADGSVTAADIARAAMMPIHYVRMVMTPEWEPAYQKLLEI
jgi:hypothetical protein